MLIIGRWTVLILMMLFGLFLMSNIYVLGNREAALEMHEDLAPSASAFMTNAKVLDCFIVGCLYLISTIGIIRKRYQLALAGVIAFILFVGFYLIELVMWAGVHPRIWIDCIIMSTLNLLMGGSSYLYWRKRKMLTW